MSSFYSMGDTLGFGEFEGKTIVEVFLHHPDYLQNCLETIPDFFIELNSIQEWLEKFPENAVLLFAEQKTQEKFRSIIRDQLGPYKFFQYPDNFTQDDHARIATQFPFVTFIYCPN